MAKTTTGGTMDTQTALQIVLNNLSVYSYKDLERLTFLSDFELQDRDVRDLEDLNTGD
jgi:hypothetical protein